MSSPVSRPCAGVVTASPPPGRSTRRTSERSSCTSRTCSIVSAQSTRSNEPSSMGSGSSGASFTSSADGSLADARSSATSDTSAATSSRARNSVVRRPSPQPRSSADSGSPRSRTNLTRWGAGAPASTGTSRQMSSSYRLIGRALRYLPMERPAVDVVVPFLGSPAELSELVGRLLRLRLRAGDTLTIVDNRPGAPPPPGHTETARPAILVAPELQTPGFARNRGAAVGSAEWLVFFDSDTQPAEDLLDLYFDPFPRTGTGLLAGGIADAAPEPGRPEPLSARWARLTASMGQDTTLGLGRWGFVQTANCALRRAAFASVGGFRDELRACEDADLCYRLEAAGWSIERREEARVVHSSRQTIRGLIGQQLVHGAGIGWLEREYPGAAPAHRLPGFALWNARNAATRLGRALRARDRDAALVAVVDPLVGLARELGRRRPNTRSRVP